MRTRYTRITLEDDPPLRLNHHKPMEKSAWGWTFVYPVMSLLPGRQTTITGEVISNHPGGMMWSGIAGVPMFATREEAIAFAIENRLNWTSSEVEFN